MLEGNLEGVIRKCALINKVDPERAALRMKPLKAEKPADERPTGEQLEKLKRSRQYSTEEFLEGMKRARAGDI
jgi:hypothetical protein